MSSITPGDRQTIARAIDHTKLTFAEGENETEAIETLCNEAREHGFYAVCVRPRHVAQAKALLLGSPVQVATVIGFPLHKLPLAEQQANLTVGNYATDEKIAETRTSLIAGADELDLVMNVARFKQDMREQTGFTQEEFRAIRNVAEGKPIKVIIETDLLSEDEIAQASRWCVEAGMAMVKTSTGMIDGGKGATPEAVQIIRDTLDAMQADTGIKASGGIKTPEQALAYIKEGGVNRLGTSSGIRLISDAADASVDTKDLVY